MNDNDSNITEEDEESNSEIGATRSGGVEAPSAIFTAARKRLKGKSPEKMTQAQFTATLNDLLDNPEKHGMSEADADRLEQAVIAISGHVNHKATPKELSEWWHNMKPHEKLGVIDSLMSQGHSKKAEFKAAFVKHHGDATKGKEHERPAATPAMAEKTSYWKRKAAEAEADGSYLPGNNWERMLEQNLRANQPEVVKQLEEKDEFEAFLTAQTWEAMLFQERLEAQGTPPRTAEELALQMLFPEQE